MSTCVVCPLPQSPSCPRQPVAVLSCFIFLPFSESSSPSHYSPPVFFLTHYSRQGLSVGFVCVENSLLPLGLVILRTFPAFNYRESISFFFCKSPVVEAGRTEGKTNNIGTLFKRAQILLDFQNWL